MSWDPERMKFQITDNAGNWHDLSHVLQSIEITDFDFNTPVNTANAIRHNHIWGYDAEWQYLRELKGRKNVDLTKWKIIVFAFLTETAILMLDWPWRALSIGPIGKETIPAKITEESVLEWLKQQVNRLKLREIFSDNRLEIEDEYLSNIYEAVHKKGKRFYTRCRQGHINVHYDEQFTEYLPEKLE